MNALRDKGAGAMPLNLNWLLLSMLVSCIGAGLFLYGKRQARLPHMVAGGVFFLYPYFVRSMLLMVIIGVLLGIGLWFAAKLDI